MKIKKFNYLSSTEDIFYKIIYPLYAREFLFDSSFEYFKKRVSTNFILNDIQWKYIQEHWNLKESLLTKQQ